MVVEGILDQVNTEDVPYVEKMITNEKLRDMHYYAYKMEFAFNVKAPLVQVYIENAHLAEKRTELEVLRDTAD